MDPLILSPGNVLTWGHVFESTAPSRTSIFDECRKAESHSVAKHGTISKGLHSDSDGNTIRDTVEN